MIRPIPKKLLIHSAELITEYTPDKWGKASERDAVKLEHVRIFSTTKHIINSNGETVQLNAELYFDCRNSSPRDIVFALKDDTVNDKIVSLQRVSFEGRFYTVQTIEPLYADKNRVHHYEVGLV